MTVFIDICRGSRAQMSDVLVLVLGVLPLLLRLLLLLLFLLLLPLLPQLLLLLLLINNKNSATDTSDKWLVPQHRNHGDCPRSILSSIPQKLECPKRGLLQQANGSPDVEGSKSTAAGRVATLLSLRFRFRGFRVSGFRVGCRLHARPALSTRHCSKCLQFWSECSSAS